MKKVLFLSLAIGCLLPLTVLAASPLDVVINEVAWGGSNGVAADEWLELYNNTASDINFTVGGNNWKIVKTTSTDPIIWTLTGTITAHGYYLIEKTDAEISDIVANQLVSNLALGNSGNDLAIQDDTNAVIDNLPCQTAGGWYAGSSTDPKPSMERKNPTVAGDVPSNWANNDGVTMNGHGSTGNAIQGTPGAQNSVYTVVIPGPDVVHIQSLSGTAIKVWFGVPVDKTTAETVANYTLNAGSDVQPNTATQDSTDPALVLLQGDNIGTIVDQSLTTLTVVGVNDLQGNPSNSIKLFYKGISSIAFVRTDADASNIPDILENNPDAFVTIQGTVNSVRDFDYNKASIQADRGISIYDTNTVAQLNRYDRITISGKLGQNKGVDELISTKLAGPPSPNAMYAVYKVTLADLLADPERYESMLVAVAQLSKFPDTQTWPAADTSVGLTFSDDAGTTSYMMYVDKDTNIDGSPEPSYPMDLMGIASQYSNANPPVPGDYEILPRNLNDIGSLFCTNEAPRECYTGPAGTDANLPCKKGMQTCDTVSGMWGRCLDEVVPQPTDNTCDGIDDNCDGATDEGADTTTDPNNCGECGHVCDGTNVNENGCAASACTITSCDAGFDDCSGGAADGCETQLGSPQNCASCGDNCNDTFPHSGACNAGVCEQGACETGWKDCIQDAGHPGCETDVLGDAQNCGDCNNACDQGWTCVQGSCSNTCPDADADHFADHECGGTDCDDADATVYPTATEICDDKDNDCDGQTDETFTDLGKPCDGSDEDLCKSGSFVCDQAGTGVVCEETVSKTEICNNVDDDCDGQTDEDWPDLSETCDGPDEDSCKNGVYACNQAGNGTVCEETTQKEEICNGIDDDCDGQTDEGFGTYTCGVGACIATIEKCINGKPQQCTPKDPPEALEVSCGDGVDNDCDGLTDKDDPDCGSDEGGGCGCGTSGASASGLLLLAAVLAFSLRRKQ